MNLAGRAEGCILGGALGDSLGRPYEGKKPPFTAVVDRDAPMQAGGDHGLTLREPIRLAISDDTQLTLATCSAIVESGSVSPGAIADELVKWHRAGRFSGLGASTQKALSELSAGGHWALSGRKGEMAAGNGAAMRIAALAFCLDLSDPDKRKVFRDVCRITHHNEEAYVGALAIALSIQAICDGRWSPGASLLRLVMELIPDSSVRDRIELLSNQSVSRPLPEIAAQFGSSGYVVDSAPLAMAGAERVVSLGFKGVLTQLISAGGDTDTIASLSGQIMGTLIGKSGLPQELMALLGERDFLEESARQFGHAVRSRFTAEAGG